MPEKRRIICVCVVKVEGGYRVAAAGAPAVRVSTRTLQINRGIRKPGGASSGGRSHPVSGADARHNRCSTGSPHGTTLSARIGCGVVFNGARCSSSRMTVWWWCPRCQSCEPWACSPPQQTAATAACPQSAASHTVVYTPGSSPHSRPHSAMSRTRILSRSCPTGSLYPDRAPVSSFSARVSDFFRKKTDFRAKNQGRGGVSTVT